MIKDIFVFGVSVNSVDEWLKGELDGAEPSRIPRCVYVDKVDVCRGVVDPQVIILYNAEYNRRYDDAFFSSILPTFKGDNLLKLQALREKCLKCACNYSPT